MRADDPGLVIALGRGAAEAASEALAGEADSRATVLPDGISQAVTALREAIGIRS